MTSVATEEERAAVDEVLGAPETAVDGLDGRVVRGGHEARERRHLLLPALQALQSRVGWISPGGLSYVSQRLTVPPAEAYGVATFYALFSTEPGPRVVVHVCDDIACRVDGAKAICEELESRLGPPGTIIESPGGQRSWTWARSPCLGQCQSPTALLVQESGAREARSTYSVHGIRDVGDVDEEGALLGGMTHEPETFVVGWGGRGGWGAPQTETRPPAEGLRLLRRIGERVDPRSLDDYRAHGGYEGLRRAVELGPEGVIRELKDAKLLGRGGAAFPTGVKWEAVARQPIRPHYFVCNADESEPGTFKDRVLMEQDPFALVEALTIAGFATGSECGYLYIRGEYPLASERLRHAIDECRARGLLGPDVMASGWAFDIELRRGAGAYICGEETALFESIEGNRGEPRNNPPFPVEGARAAGATLGSGVVMVFDDRADLPGALRRIAAFFRDESCGQYVPCRVGTVRQEELLARLVVGRPMDGVDGELVRLRDVGQAMRDASICGLGQTASSAIESAVRAGLVHFEPAE